MTSSILLFLLDARVDPVHDPSWTALLVLLAIIFVSAVSIVTALVFILVWLKRRKPGSSQ